MPTQPKACRREQFGVPTTLAGQSLERGLSPPRNRDSASPGAV